MLRTEPAMASRLSALEARRLQGSTELVKEITETTQATKTDLKEAVQTSS
ncbi:MAG: hypothetical protein HC869_07315 [Rhodospirillales bacterium]|nr:hypothetical protein [Rhodospirillales bacterium]